MMNLNISEVVSRPGAEMGFEFNLEQIGDTGEIILNGPIKVKGKLLNTGSVLELSADVKAQILSSCNRCLEALEIPLDFTFTERYARQGEAAQELFEEGEMSAVMTYQEEIIDLVEAVKDNLILNVPMRILCREDCPGLCAQCGHSLKEGPCGCTTKEIDPRLAILAKLKKN
jgi:uncharacterized protein